MGHECIVTDLTGEDVESRRFHLKYLDFCLLFKKSWNSSSPGPHSHSHTWGASPFRQAWTCGLSQLPPSLLSLVCLAPLLGVGSPTRWSWWNIRPTPPAPQSERVMESCIRGRVGGVDVPGIKVRRQETTSCSQNCESLWREVKGKLLWPLFLKKCQKAEASCLTRSQGRLA